MLEEGKSVPKFEVKDSNGNSVKSSDFKGKKHVIYFYPKDFTPGCTTEADEFSKDYKKFQKAGIEIIGISPDDVDSHKKFCDKMGIKYPLLADVDKTISKEFGKNGRKKVEKNYSWDKIGKKLENVCLEVANSSTRHDPL